MKNKDLNDAVAAGTLKTMPVEKGAYVDDAAEILDTVIDNPQDFQIAIGHAQMAGRESIEVSDRLFDYMVKTSKTEDYFTYGNPGVRVYREGVREKIEHRESLGVDEYLRQSREK